MASEPVLLIGLGRGRTGKSTALRLLLDRARSQGRPVIPADGDRSNATLTSYYADATRPRSAEDEDVRVWLTEILDRMVSDRVSVVLDLGGGDRTLAAFGRDLGLVEFCQAVGVRAVALHFIGPDLDDLAHVDAMESSRAFAPERTAIVLNEGLVRAGQTPSRAFEPIMEREEFRAVMKRGAEWVIMPRLGCMPDLDQRRLGFYGQTDGLGPARSFMVQEWRRKMEAGFSSIGDWLP